MQAQPGFLTVEGTGKNGVLLVSEHLIESEVADGLPLRGRAGFLFGNLLQRAGLNREDFTIATAAWCMPPDNKLEGHPDEYRTLAHCKRAHLLPLIERIKPKVIVPMGNVPLWSLMGVKGVQEMRGYPEWDSQLNCWILPTVHPNFIMKGNTNWGGVFIHDIAKAVEIAAQGWSACAKEYSLDPDVSAAWEWADDYRRCLERDGRTRLAYDIETPYKGEDEEEADADNESYQIDRIGFAYKANHALSIPWNDAYLPIIRALMGSEGEKVVWNQAFDNTRIQANGVHIGGLVHDGMVAWHVLNSDLPKNLGFVATFLVPRQSRWKHLSGSQPAYYNAIDADVELQAMQECERLLRATNLWETYDKQVLKLDPVLRFMSRQGMPVDGERRLAYAIKLDEKLRAVEQQVQESVPREARKLEVRKQVPKKLPAGAELQYVDGERKVRVCSMCGAENKKPHVTRRTIEGPLNAKGKKTRLPNPCLGGIIEQRFVPAPQPAILHAFNAGSPQQLLRYMAVKGHKPVMTGKPGQKKPTTDEKALKILIGKYADKFYSLVLEKRELDKLAGTYIGRVEEVAA